MLDKLLLVLVGLAFFMYGVEDPLLSLFGTETTGVVAAVEAQPAREASSVRDWRVTYRFQTTSGKSITGSAERSQVYNTSTLPCPGCALSLKYLETLPFINQPTSDAGFGLVNLGVMAVGLVLMASGLLGAGRPHRRRAV
ncbi:MAG: hypothetical protein ACOY93_12790 [Bacillota bacterium]